jgi:hypothetical protein
LAAVVLEESAEVKKLGDEKQLLNVPLQTVPLPPREAQSRINKSSAWLKEPVPKVGAMLFADVL